MDNEIGSYLAGTLVLQLDDKIQKVQKEADKENRIKDKIIAGILNDIEELENKLMKDIDLQMQVTELEKELKKQTERLDSLYTHILEQEMKIGERLNNLEKVFEKVPEFYDYWKKLNACGYID